VSPHAAADAVGAMASLAESPPRPGHRGWSSLKTSYRAQSIAALVEENPEAGMFVEVLTSMTDYGACLAGIPCAAAASPHSASLTQDAP
jgi:hypothetical protein